MRLQRWEAIVNVSLVLMPVQFARVGRSFDLGLEAPFEQDDPDSIG